MRLMKRSVVAAAICISAIAMAGCAKPKPAEQTPAPAPAPVAFKVLSLELGSAIGPDKKVTAPKAVFGTNETIFVSVATEGASPGATLAARWTYGDAAQLVNEMSETIAPTGPANTEFHISKPTAWPTGKYRVEVTLDGSPAGSKEFEVR
jgi:hypothetical protein